MPKPDKDPYAPPPRYRDHSGALVRVVIIAALLGVAVWGYTYFADQEQVAALAPETAQEQQMAQAQPGYGALPTMPAEPETATPGQQPAPVQGPGQTPATPGAQPSTSPPPATAPSAPAPQ